jgi:cytidylate kinase
MIETDNSPVIAIDGPSASGKGTVAAEVAKALGWRYLDSGSLYRLTALAALRSGTALEDEEGLVRLASGLPVEFREGVAWLAGEDVSVALRQEDVGTAASQVASQPRVRQALLARQRGFRQPPGLVADGRDMGSVVFPEAALKVYLTADVGTRAERRHKQLMEKGMYAKMQDVVDDLRRRDERDTSRPVAPLKHYPDAVFLDTTGLSVAQAVAKILGWWRERGESPKVSGS